MSDQQKPGGGESTQLIRLKVVVTNSFEVHFRVKMTTQFQKLRKAFSDRMSIPATSLHFVWNGRQIYDLDTPKELKMENGDIIKVYQEQTGGFDFIAVIYVSWWYPADNPLQNFEKLSI